jgi:hypothetical protein
VFFFIEAIDGKACDWLFLRSMHVALILLIFILRDHQSNSSQDQSLIKRGKEKEKEGTISTSSRQAAVPT